MKIAICLSGLLRDWRKSLSSIKENLIREYDVDLFIHSWNSEKTMQDDKWGINSNESPHDGNGESQIDMRTSSIKSIIHTIDNEIYPVTASDLDKQSEMVDVLDKLKSDLGEKYNKSWSPHNFSCWLYSLHKCNQIKNDYAKYYNIKYDYVIRVRTELEFLRPLTQEDFDEVQNGILIPEGADYNQGINDMFAIGTNESINWYCDLMNRITNYQERNPHKIFQEHLDEWQNTTNNPIKRFNFPYNLRGNRPSGM